MQTYLKTRPVWAQVALFIGLAAGGALVFVMIGSVIASNITGISLLQIGDASKWDPADGRYVVFMRIMLLMQFIGLFAGPSLLFAYLSDPKPMGYLGLRKTSPLAFVLGIAAIMAAIPLVEYIGFLNQKIQFPTRLEPWLKQSEKEAQQQITMLLKTRNGATLLLNLVMVAGFAGIGEELFFRGVLQRLAIWGFKNVWAGILLAAFLFSALHLQFYGFFPRFLLGVLLGVIYWYSGSIWPSVVAHFFYDATLIVLAYFNPAMLAATEGSFIPTAQMGWMALLSAAATAGLVWLLRKNSTRTLAQFEGERYLYPKPPLTFEP